MKLCCSFFQLQITMANYYLATLVFCRYTRYECYWAAPLVGHRACKLETPFNDTDYLKSANWCLYTSSSSCTPYRCKNALHSAWNIDSLSFCVNISAISYNHVDFSNKFHIDTLPFRNIVEVESRSKNA